MKNRSMLRAVIVDDELKSRESLKKIFAVRQSEEI